MKWNKWIRGLALTAAVVMTMPIAAQAMDYNFTTDAPQDFYKSGSYEDVYGSQYNYGGKNVVDFQIPELEYGRFSTTQTGVMERTILPGLQAAVATSDGTAGGYGVSGGGPVTVLTEAGSAAGGTEAFLPDTSVSQFTVTEAAQNAYTSVESLKQSDGSIGTVKIPSLGINMKVWEGETNESMKKGMGHYSSTSAWAGNVGVCGHNRGAKYVIGDIKNLKKGDIITYIRDNETTTVTVTNAPFSGIIIHKINSVTGDGIYDVKFLLYDENKNPIGEYSTDNEGYIYIDDLVVQGKGRLYLRELEAAPGYELDKEYKTIYVQPGKTIEIEWKNTPITGQIQVMKYAAEYNEVTGTPAGTPLQGAVYEISDPRSNKVVDYITTDARGIAASKPLPLGRYKIVEVTAPAYWQLSGTVFDETLEYSGQIIKVSDYDKPAGLGVVITKRGNAEVLAGNQMRYDFTVANSSNVALEEFYWHDRIPTDAAKAMTITTGTYSARLNYRILYKTNYSGTYQVLASNLITTSSYSFSLSAIPTQAGEVVTDVYFDFGKVPVGFQSTSNPTLTVAISGTAANGYQLVNRADAGGKYQGTWQTAQGTWTTVIRKLTSSTPLPKTGY